MKQTPNYNARRMIDAILLENDSAGKANRVPCSSNVLHTFRQHMRPILDNDQINELFDIVFDAYKDVTGSWESEHSNN